MKARFFALTIALLVGGVAALSWTFSIWRSIGDAMPEVQVVRGPRITSEFELVDQNGRTVRDEDFAGKWQLVFFGFTSCPEICPTTLGTISAVLEDLGPTADQLQPLLITVDPERDTAAVLKDYLTPFDPRILGLTGLPAQVQDAMRGFRVYAGKQPLEGGDYTMDHSAFIYLMDPTSQYATHFGAQTSMEEITAEIRKRLTNGDAT